MTPFSWEYVLDDRGLALLTAPRVTPAAAMYLADFKDMQALAYKETKHFIGISKTRGIRLGGHPIRLVDGLWYITEDRESGFEDLQISHEALCLQPIR